MGSGQPMISIVMPTFNQAAFIERSICSVLEQDYPNRELIVIDGGSRDGTIDVIRRYESHLAHWESKPDKGQSDALNHGFARARGAIFGWLNSDDLYLPGALSRAAEAFARSPRKSVVFGDWHEIDANDACTGVCYAFDFSLKQMIYEGFHLNAQAMFWRSEAHRRFGEFDTSLHLAMDHDFIVRLGLTEGQWAFKRIPYALASFRHHEAQKTQGPTRATRDEDERIAAKIGATNKSSLFGRALRLGYRARRAYWYFRRGGLAYVYSRSAGWRARRLHRDSANKSST